MIAIADKRIPEAAKNSLETYALVLYLETAGITYPAVSGHPDVFFCQTRDGLVCAPNVPTELTKQLVSADISVITGKHPIENKFPDTAILNAVVTDKYLIHHQKYTDPHLKKSCSHLESIHVNQAYTRCNLIPLNDDRFITSDRGIEKALITIGNETLYVNPKRILLSGYDHGFIGGTSGIIGNRIFFIGSLKHFREGEKLRSFLKAYEIIELYDGPFFDGGSLLFVDTDSKNS